MGQKKPTIAVSAEVCPRRRQIEECVMAFREGQGEKTPATMRHDVMHAGRSSGRVRLPYIGI